MRTIRKHEFTVPVWAVGIIENRLEKDHIAAYGKDGWLDVLHVRRFLRKNPVVKAGLTTYTDAGFRWKNDVSPLASDCMTLTVIEYVDDKESAEIVKGYGWNPETLKAECLSAARQIVIEHEDENGNVIFAVDPDCENDGRAEAAAVFLNSEQRSTEQLFRDFFGVEAENPEYIEEETEEHAVRMSDALRSLILPEIENQFPGPDWSVFVGFGEGILGVFVQAEQKE